MLLGRHRLPLALQEAEPRGQPSARLGWQDHLVEVAVLGCHVGVREALLVLRYQPRAFGVGVGRLPRCGLGRRCSPPPRRPSPRSRRSATRSSDPPRMCLLLMTSYAPPYALRVMTVNFGTVASQYAYSSLAPCRMMPRCSWSTPGRKPGTSTRVTSGMLKQSQKRTKRAALSDASMSSTPASTSGCWATMPTLRPSIAGEAADDVPREVRVHLRE